MLSEDDIEYGIREMYGEDAGDEYHNKVSSTKRLKFLETIEDKQTGVKWIKGHRYKVTYGGDDYYILRKQNGIPVSIGKECKGRTYIVIQEKKNKINEQCSKIF